MQLCKDCYDKKKEEEGQIGIFYFSGKGACDRCKATNVAIFTEDGRPRAEVAGEFAATVLTEKLKDQRPSRKG